MLAGAHSHLFRGGPAAVATACQRAGLTCVQLTPSFPGLRFDDPQDLTPKRCRLAVEPFLTAGLRVACLSGSVNLLDPELDNRHRGIVRLHCLIRHCRNFGTNLIVTETGSLSPGSPLVAHPANQARTAWDELRLIVAEALQVAADHGVTLLLKPGGAHVLSSADDARRLQEELSHPNLGFVLDPADLLSRCQPDDRRVQLEQLVEKLGPSAPVIYAQDLRDEADKGSAPGTVDYGQLLRLLRRHQAEPAIILVHLRPEEVTGARQRIEQAIRDSSVS